MGTRSFRVITRPRRGVYHPPHLTPKLKKKYSYTSTPSLGLHSRFVGFTLPSISDESSNPCKEVSWTVTVLTLNVTECDVLGNVVENNRVLQQ
jgi:hypothetical protein